MNNNPPKRSLSNLSDTVDHSITQSAKKRDKTNQQARAFPGSITSSIDMPTLFSSETMSITDMLSQRGSRPNFSTESTATLNHFELTQQLVIYNGLTLDGQLTTSAPFASRTATQDAASLLEQRLLALRAQRLEEYRQQVFIPLMAKASLHALDKDLFPLMDKVQEFLASDRQVMLVLGDSGAGKSTWNRHLDHFLWTRYNRNTPIPLFINLPAIRKPEKDMVGKQLRTYNFTSDQVQELKQHRRFIVICDGYDECQLTINLHETNRLNQNNGWCTQMIITCRTQFLGPAYRDRFEPRPLDHYHKVQRNLFQEAVISPFSKEQVKQYVTHYVLLRPQLCTTDDYMQMLAEIPNLMDMVKNPFLLSLALEALPGVTMNQQELSTINITRIQLYDYFVDEWLSVNMRRLRACTFDKDDRDMLEHMIAKGFVSLGIEYAKRLALAIFDKNAGIPLVQYIHLDHRDSWRAEFFGPQPRARLLYEACPLTRIGNMHQFVHRSILEYFLSRAIFDPSTSHDGPEPQQDSSSSVDHSLDPSGPLFTHNLLREPSVLKFLYERVPQHPHFKEQLLAVVEMSKHDPSFSQAAANAMTILIKARVRFNGADLRGIRIPGADLFGGQFDTAQFQGADLTNTNLTRAWIRQADFTGTHMTGANFGILPLMKESCSVYCCAISTNGTLLAAGLKDGRISLYDTSTWTKIGTLLGHTRRVTSIAFSPADSGLISGSYDNTVRLWDPLTQQLSRILTGHTKEVLDIAFSPNGYRIASASKDETVRVWNRDSAETELVYDGHEEEVTSVSWSPDGYRVASGSSDASIRIWDSLTGANIIQSHDNMWYVGITCAEFSPDGQWIVSGNQQYILQLRNATNGKLVRCLGDCRSGFNSIVFSPNGCWMATCSFNFVKLWDTETFTERIVWDDHSRLVTGVAFSPDSSQIVSCSLDRTICRAELNTVDSTLDSQDDFCAGSTLVYSTDGQQILSNYTHRGIYRWDPITGASEELMKHEEELNDIAFSPSRELFAARCRNDRTFTQWDIATGKSDRTFHGHTEEILCLAYSPCGSWIASGGRDISVRLWNMSDGTPGHILIGHTKNIRTAIFSPDSLQIASGSDDNTVRLWDTHNGNLIATLLGHSDIISDLSYSPDGTIIASGSWDTTVRLWNTQTGAPGTVFDCHTRVVSCIAFSPCGKWLASGGCDKRIQLCQVQPIGSQSRLCYEMRGFLNRVGNIVWHPCKRDQSDHLEFATGCDDTSIRVWRLTLEGEQVRVCLVWGTHVYMEFSSDAKISDAIDLSDCNREYLVERLKGYSSNDADEINSESDADTESEDKSDSEDMSEDEGGELESELANEMD